MRSTKLSLPGASCVLALLLICFGPAHAAQVKNVVIVHGALADGSGWRKVHDRLTAKGYNVTVVQPPMTSLQDDVAATKRVLDLQPGPSSNAANSPRFPHRPASYKVSL